MAIFYEKPKNNRSGRYKVRTNGLNLSYSEKSYGKYAKLLAGKTNETGIRYNNYIYEKKNYCVMIIMSKGEEIKVKFDKEDLDLVMSHRWFESNGYIRSKIKGSNSKKIILLHHLIYGDFDKEQYIIDHKNRDTYDNRRKNLRAITSTGNNRNRTTPITSKTGVMGVYPIKKRGTDEYYAYEVSWVDINGIKHAKDFNFKKYGSEQKAFEEAKKFRKEVTKHYTKIHKIKVIKDIV